VQVQTSKFDECFDKFQVASSRADALVKKMKTANEEQRRRLIAELKKCDEERHSAIECMEEAMGHH
jgi:hypothetical protein